MDIKLTNTLSRKKAAFAPLDTNNVRMYLCGPTVYDRAHLGNARPVVMFDVLFRLLHLAYGADHVTYARNFTDVDDRINETARQRKADGAAGSLEDLIHERANETIAWYHADMAALGNLSPNVEPRATEYIGQMVEMIEELAAKGFAYGAEGHALFRVSAYETYGRLSGRSIDDMIAGARVEVAPFKENPMDFVLWKPSSDDEPGWDGPVIDGVSLGRGRPGWHIECSAMSHALLGESFDIHGGGLDLQFPHHENEIAQSCACGHGFASVWLHNEMLQVEGKKMSKSLGNFFTVRDLLDQGVPGEVIRFVFLSTHYSKPMDWTETKRAEAEATLQKWHKMAQGSTGGQIDPSVLSAVADDLNTPGALTALHALAKNGDAAALAASAQFLGLLDADQTWWQSQGLDDDAMARVTALQEQRVAAKKAKDFATADAIRDALAGVGVAIVDGPGGTFDVNVTPAFDQAALMALSI